MVQSRRVLQDEHLCCGGKGLMINTSIVTTDGIRPDPALFESVMNGNQYRMISRELLTWDGG
jgi:hypothetical protein